MRKTYKNKNETRWGNTVQLKNDIFIRILHHFNGKKSSLLLTLLRKK